MEKLQEVTVAEKSDAQRASSRNFSTTSPHFSATPSASCMLGSAALARERCGEVRRSCGEVAGGGYTWPQHEKSNFQAACFPVFDFSAQHGSELPHVQAPQYLDFAKKCDATWLVCRCPQKRTPSVGQFCGSRYSNDGKRLACTGIFACNLVRTVVSTVLVRAEICEKPFRTCAFQRGVSFRRKLVEVMGRGQVNVQRSR